MAPEKPKYRKPVRLFTKQWLAVWLIVAILGFFVLPQAIQLWQINSWSIQYARHLLNPQPDQSQIPDPPTRHARADLWLAAYALHSGEPAVAEQLITAKASQGDPLARDLMLAALLAQDKYTEAVELARSMADPVLLRTVANQAQTAGNFTAALQAYQASWNLDAQAGTLPLVNFLVNYQHDDATAETVLRSALLAYPDSGSWSSWSNRLGDVLRSAKRWDEAEAAYQASLAKDPQDWSAHYGLGWVYYERGDGLLAALDEFQIVFASPESRGQGQYATGQVLVREQRYAEAYPWYAQAIELNPQNRWFYLAYGNAARQGGDLDLALGLYQQAVLLFPDFANAYYELAYAWQLSAQPGQAMAAIQKALTLVAPPNLNFFLRAGAIFEGASQPVPALENYRQALQLDPTNTSALAGLQRLQP